MVDSAKYIQAGRLRDYCCSIFKKVGMPSQEAFINADNLVEADLTGVESHGVSRLAIYMKRLRLGGVRPALELKAVVDAPAIGVYDACNSMGAVAAYKSMEAAIAKAKISGISFISVRNSNHYGTAAYFAKMALSHEMIGFTATNGAPRIAPWGSRTPFFGTNPFAVAIPAGRELPIVADMATCVVARGKIILAAKKNQPIPLGWAMTEDGEDTTDSQAALAGAVLPFGGPKGSAIACIIEVLTGILAGSAFSTQIPDMYVELKNPTPISHYFAAINIAAFGSVEEFKSNVDDLIGSIKTSPKAKNVSEIFMPGEIELRKREQRLKEGIPINNIILDELRREGETFGIPYSLES